MMYVQIQTSTGGESGDEKRKRERERERESKNMETLNSRQSSQSIKEFPPVIFLQLNDRSIKIVKRSSCLYSVRCMLKSLCEFTVEKHKKRAIIIIVIWTLLTSV